MKSDLAKRGICLIAGLYALLPVAGRNDADDRTSRPAGSAAWISPTRPQQASHLTLDEAIYAAQTQSIAAMVAKYTFLSSYWSYRSYRASRLPSLNLTGEVLSFDRSLRLLQDHDTGEMRYMENYNLQNTLGLSIKQNIALTGGTLRLYSSLNRLDQFAPKDSKSYDLSRSRSPTPNRSSPTINSNGTRRSPPRSTNWPNARTSKRWRTSRYRQ